MIIETKEATYDPITINKGLLALLGGSIQLFEAMKDAGEITEASQQVAIFQLLDVVQRLKEKVTLEEIELSGESPVPVGDTEGIV